MELLGTDRESIGREKAGIMRTGEGQWSSAIRMPPQSVYLTAPREIGADLWVAGRDFNVSG
jgi:dihydrofolate synthase/folylpolyglutamate synthase